MDGLFKSPTNISNKIVIITSASAHEYKNSSASYAHVIWKVEFSFGSMAIFCYIKIVVLVSGFEMYHETLGWVYKITQPHVHKCTHI